MRTTAKERGSVMAGLTRLGIDYNDAEALRRIAMTLNRWFEMECGTDNGCIERDETTGKPYWLNPGTVMGKSRRDPIPDREAGAKERLAKVMSKYPALVPYIQGDCRGASIYILRKDDIRDGENLDSIYNRGVAVY